MKIRMLLVVFAAILLLSACSANEPEQDANSLKVYTTVYPLQYFTERIGGDFVDVESIYPPGTDEHMFEPTQKEMMKLAEADLFIYIGLGLEGFVDNAKNTLKNEHVKMIAAAEQINTDLLEEGHEHHDDEGDAHDDQHEGAAVDPHVWISPYLSVQLAEEIKTALSEELPEHTEQFEENFNALYDDLELLDRKLKTMADEAPNKTFFVSHAAFGYLADAYGLKQLSVSGLDSQNEPSQKQLAELVKEANERNIRYILFEQNVSSKLAEVIQKEIGAQPLELHNLSVLTEEDLANNENYITLTERNIEVLKKALSNE